jgi:hypothetical protein
VSAIISEMKSTGKVVSVQNKKCKYFSADCLTPVQPSKIISLLLTYFCWMRHESKSGWRNSNTISCKIYCFFLFMKSAWNFYFLVSWNIFFKWKWHKILFQMEKQNSHANLCLVHLIFLDYKKQLVKEAENFIKEIVSLKKKLQFKLRLIKI